MSELDKRAVYSIRYDSMSTEELQEILHKHANGELQAEPDTQELYYIMEMLAERRKQQTPQEVHSNEAAFVEFCKYYMPKDKEERKSKIVRFPNRFFKTVAAVLVAVLILTVGMTITAEALPVSIWGNFANWTKEIFQFIDPNPENKYNAELRLLRDVLKENAIKEKIAPTWMPEGYTNKKLQVEKTPTVLSISAVYEKDGSELSIKIRRAFGMQAEQVEKNDDLLEVYVVDGVEYYIFSNTETLQAKWNIIAFECSISGKITLEEMKMMIDSMR